MNLKPFLLFAILAFFPIDSAQSIEHSLKLQKKCERLIKRFAGKASYEMNNNYYGKGVKRPSTSLWKLKRYSKPFFSETQSAITSSQPRVMVSLMGPLVNLKEMVG